MFKKIISIVLSLFTIFTMFSCMPTVSAVSKPDVPTVRYVESRIKGVFYVVFDTLFDSDKISNTWDNDQYSNAGLCDGYQIIYSTDKTFKTNKKYLLRSVRNLLE